jgi:hypothetical protein
MASASVPETPLDRLPHDLCEGSIQTIADVRTLSADPLSGSLDCVAVGVVVAHRCVSSWIAVQ